MTAPCMAKIFASLEQSLQNCSLSPNGSGAGGAVARSATPDSPENLMNTNNYLELDSHIALPYQWEQYLDLKTGEIYYMDWQNGTKEKEDPRKMASYGGDFFPEEHSSYDDGDMSSSGSSHYSSDDYREEGDHVLVVAGCKRCFMYFMLPKEAEECPKCDGLILHLDRSENESHKI